MRAALLLVVGNDALLAARPATPVQLAHAALAAGYDAVVPASWGDELVAAACARHVATTRASASVFCACPYVAQRVLCSGTELSPFLASFVSPPAALARYLRTFYQPGHVRLTFVGRCPGAHGSYDAVIAPAEFLRLLADRQIVPEAQPDAFEAILPPDRRRFYSLPGGLPSVTTLRSVGAPHGIVEVGAADFAADVAQHLLGGVPVLVDGAARLGCSCAGASEDESRDGRAELMEIDPPRAFAPVVELPPGLGLELTLPRASRDATDLIAAAAHPALTSGNGGPPEPAEPAAAPPAGEHVVPRAVDLAADAPHHRRRSPSGGIPVVRPPAGYTPIARATDGRILPRAYVARRRAGPRPPFEDGDTPDRQR